MKSSLLLLIACIACVQDLVSGDDCHLNAEFNVMYEKDGNYTYVEKKNLDYLRYDVPSRKIILSNGVVNTLCKRFLDQISGEVMDLELSHMQIQKIVKYAFIDMTNLKSLKITNNNLFELIPGMVSDLGVELLDLSRNALSFIHYEAFEGMRNLKVLILDYNKVTSMDEDWFASKPRLNYFSLRHNQIDELTDNLFRRLSSSNDCDIEEESLDKSCPRIYLSNNRINKVALQTFGRLKNFHTIALDDNYIGEVVPVFITNAKIKVLSLERNQIPYLKIGYVEHYQHVAKNVYLNGNPLNYRMRLQLKKLNEKDNRKRFVFDRVRNDFDNYYLNGMKEEHAKQQTN